MCAVPGQPLVCRREFHVTSLSARILLQQFEVVVLVVVGRWQWCALYPRTVKAHVERI